MNSAYIQVPNRTNEWVQEQVPIWMRLYLVIGQGLFLPLLVLGKKKKITTTTTTTEKIHWICKLKVQYTAGS